MSLEQSDSCVVDLGQHVELQVGREPVRNARLNADIASTWTKQRTSSQWRVVSLGISTAVCVSTYMRGCELAAYLDLCGGEALLTNLISNPVVLITVTVNAFLGDGFGVLLTGAIGIALLCWEVLKDRGLIVSDVSVESLYSIWLLGDSSLHSPIMVRTDLFLLVRGK